MYRKKIEVQFTKGTFMEETYCHMLDPNDMLKESVHYEKAWLGESRAQGEHGDIHERLIMGTVKIKRKRRSTRGGVHTGKKEERISTWKMIQGGQRRE